MADSIRLGSVFGISVELHWTIVLLFLFSLIIPALFFFFLLVFLSVFLHELSHSLTALRNGVRVRKILLNPIGGASILDDINLDPRIEFKISIVGPLSNIVIAGLAGMLVTFTPIGPVTQTVQLLFEINLLLGVGNILPIFPLDGGRIFRSYLQETRSKFDATMMTARMSKALLLLIVLGTLAFVLLETSYSPEYREFVFLWDLFIVIVLYGGTRAEEQMAVIRKETAGLTIKDAIRRKFIFTEPGRMLSDLYTEIKDAKDHIAITRMGNDFYFAAINRARRTRGAVLVRDVAVGVPTFTEKTNLVDALATIEGNDAPLGVVLKGNKPVGVVTAAHLESIISLHMLAQREKQLRRKEEQGI